MTDEEKAVKGREALLKDIEKYVKLLNNKDFQGVITPPPEFNISEDFNSYAKEVQQKMLLEIKECALSATDKSNPFSSMVYATYYDSEHDRRGINIVLKEMLEVQLEMHIVDIVKVIKNIFKEGEFKK